MSFISKASINKEKENPFFSQLELKLASHYQDSGMSEKGHIKNFCFEELEFHHFYLYSAEIVLLS